MNNIALLEPNSEYHEGSKPCTVCGVWILDPIFESGTVYCLMCYDHCDLSDDCDLT